MNMHVKFVGPALLAALILAAMPARANKATDTLVYASNSEVDNISPYHNNQREGLIVSRHVWDTLVYTDPKTGEYTPELATSWKWESPTALVMDLRQGVTFHNGDKFTADDVVFTLNWAVSPEAKVVTRQNVDWIKNAEKLGDYKVRINLVKPFPAALEYLASVDPIFPEAYFRKVGLSGFSKAPIGSGPYKITAVTPKGVTMVKNTAYWAGSPLGQPKIGTLKFVVVPDAETRAAQLMTGEIDWIWRVPADQADSLKAQSGFTVQGGETMRVGYLAFDAQGSTAPNSPFKDVRVRRALNYAINRKVMATELVRGGSQVVNTPCFRTQFGCDASAAVQYTYDPAKAKALLKEAGYPNGFETEIYAYRDRDMAEAMIGDLRKVGVTAKLRFMQYPAMRTEFRAGKVPIAFLTWASNSVNDASAFTSIYFTGGADDNTKDNEVKGWLEAADTAVDPAARKAGYSRAIHKITDQAYWAPLLSYPTIYAYTSSLNFQAYPDEMPRFYQSTWK
jgi:peptide/nickel transport system substrate-binding protein